MPPSGPSTLSKIGSIVSDFLLCLVKIIWYTAISIFKFFMPVQKKDVKKEIVLVTGSASGIGRLMAIRFAEQGAYIVLWDISTQANESVCEEIRSNGGRAKAYTCDLRNRDDIYQTAAKVKRDVGSVTILINNAGIVTGKKFFDSSDEMIDLTFKINTIAHFWTIKAFVPDMISKNHGHIITIASGAGLFGISGLVDYCASKFGAVGIHESLTMELDVIGCTDVKTLCVCPYFINTGMFDGVKTRFPWLLPILSPEYAVDRIIQSYNSNQEMLCMPKVVYIFLFLQSFLPKKAALNASRFIGVTKAMDTFKGRQPSKKDS